MPRARNGLAQAWVELVTDDPEAVSALGVARAHLEAGRGLAGLRRLRLFELSGPLPARAELEELLHRSTQFYNPHKERCVLRFAAREPAPVGPEEAVIRVSERGGERRPAAERWWRHETGSVVEVGEAAVWALRFEPGSGDPEALAVVRDRRHGLLANPHSQDCAIARGEVPFPFVLPARARGRSRRTP